MTESSVVLIGPAAVGKSTVGPLLADRLGTSFVDLDGVAASYYAEAGRSLNTFVAKVDEFGYPDAHRWWQSARLHAVRRVLEDHPGAVVALGAGHSHFEDTMHAKAVEGLLRDQIVVLLMPEPDPHRSITTLRRRAEASKGHDWIRDGVDYLDLWVRSPQNRSLADHVVYCLDRSPGTLASDVAEKLSRL
jgi:shikimate kinase